MEFGLSGAVQLASSSLAGRRPAPREPAREPAHQLDSVMESGLSLHRNYVYIYRFGAIASFWHFGQRYNRYTSFGSEAYLSLFKFFSVLPFIMVNKDVYVLVENGKISLPLVYLLPRSNLIKISGVREPDL